MECDYNERKSSMNHALQSDATDLLETPASPELGVGSQQRMVSGRSNFQSSFLAGDSSEQREPNDYYKTPPRYTLPMLARERFDGVVWECACGDGAISRVLPGEVISTDLHDRGFGESGVDFLATTKQVNHIVTNPPYSLAQKFVEHALQCVSGKVAMLLKLNFLEGQKRKPFFERTPLRTVYVFSDRISFDKGDVESKGSGLLAYAWFVWEIGYQGKPTLEWIKSESANDKIQP